MILTAQPLIKSAGQVEEERANRLAALQPVIPVPLHSKLSAHVRACWDDARQAKQTVQSRMLSCARRVREEYDPTVLAAIREMTEGSEVFIPATRIKRDAARDYLLDIYRATERPWDVKPTPIPDMPFDLEPAIIARVQQEIMSAPGPLTDQEILDLDARARKEVAKAVEETAKERAERMRRQIDDDLTEGEWFDAFTEVVDDVVTYPAGILKGPVYRMKSKMVWVDKPDGSWDVEVRYELTKQFERVSPFDFYPQRNIRKLEDGYCIERLRLNRRKVSEMKGVKGYNDAEIDAVLAEAATGGLKSSWLFSSNDAYADEGEERDTFQDSPEGRIDGLEFWGSVPGQWLLEWGMDKSKIPDSAKEYQATVILIGTHVIRAALNPHPLGRNPYHMVSWSKNNGTVWGRGIPEITAPIQDILNAAVRALVNNVAIASGPLVGVDFAMVPPGMEFDKLRPWQIIELNSAEQNGLGGRDATKLPIIFFQPTMQAETLLNVINAFMRFMDEYTGIPSYTHGAVQESGAGATSSGLAMLMTAQGKIIKNVAAKIDANLVVPSITRVFEHHMLYNPDQSIKGDATIVAVGSGSLIAKEQKLIRLRELKDSMKNETDLRVIGLPGYAKLVKKVLSAYDMNLDDVMPDIDELLKRDAALQESIRLNDMAQTANLTQQQPQTLDVAGQPSQGMDTNVFVPQQQESAA